MTLPALRAQTSPAIEKKVDALLKQMTIEEKVGQMTQVAIDVVTQGSATGTAHQLDPAKLETAVVKYKVGSILNVNGEAYTVDHWHEVINAIQDAAAKTRLKIPVIYGIDSIHGATYTRGATLFPQSIAMAATFNPDLALRAGEISAFQTRASGIPWNFFPVFDNGRQPLWPRQWETFGEDTLVAREMGKAYVRGLQGNDMSAPDKVAACVKHYAGYGLPWNGKDRTPAWIDERMLRQYVLPPYEAGVKAGAPTVMVNSGEINGIPGHANYHLLTEILKQEWGFQGFVVSDWEDIKRLHARDRVAETPKDAVRMAVMAGLDMSMVPMDFSFYDLLLACARDKSVPMARIDDAVRRILRVKFMTGLFDRPRPDPAMKAKFDQPAFAEANLAAAREVITLLKNRNGVLPLAPGRKILVTGPTADMLSVLNGGWTITWQGDKEDAYPRDKLTILRAIEQAAGKANVAYVPGTTFDKAIDITAAVSAAAKADVIVAALGEKAYCETPGNIEDLTLDDAQRELVAALAGTGKPIVTVLAQGRPRVLRNVAAQSDAILMAYLPGMEGGRAIAEVLFGKTNPSGKLPFTYPRGPNGFTTYDYKALENTNDNKAAWEFEFGYGLSYTTFAYSDLKIDGLNVSVAVRNTGARAGKEVVQLYVSDLYRSISPPNKELKGFRKVELQPGETQTVSFPLARADLAFVGLDNKWITELGKFGVRIAQLQGEFTLAATGAAAPPYPPSKAITRLTWDQDVLRMGVGKDGKTGDNWPITWGADDALYTSYGDGGGFTNPERALTLGFARIIGNPPGHRGEDILSDADTPAGWGNKGIKSSGMLMVDGTLYMFVRNYVAAGSFRHSRLAWSKNLGKNWTWAGWHFSDTFGCPDFVQYGRNYAGARDGYVYIASQANDDAYAFSPGIVMARVRKGQVAERQDYEFFAGLDAQGKPKWDRRIENRKPVFTDPRGTQRISLTYNAGIRRYILTSSHKLGEGPHNPSLGVFDAPEPWGPWTTLYYDDHWSGDDRTYHHKFPAKWISRDGRTMWLLFSGLGGGNYAFCLRKATLEIPAR